MQRSKTLEISRLRFCDKSGQFGVLGCDFQKIRKMYCKNSSEKASGRATTCVITSCSKLLLLFRLSLILTHLSGTKNITSFNIKIPSLKIADINGNHIGYNLYSTLKQLQHRTVENKKIFLIAFNCSFGKSGFYVYFFFNFFKQVFFCLYCNGA